MSKQAVEKRSECFECLSMNGKTSRDQCPSVRPERGRRTPGGFSTAGKKFDPRPLRIRGLFRGRGKWVNDTNTTR
jgi:hypothetical protein